MNYEDNLVHMANQIGAFFEAMPDGDEASAGIAQHLKKFWDPRMRLALLARLDSRAAHGIAPLVSAALQEHRKLLA